MENKTHCGEIPLNSIKIGDYASHIINNNLIKHYIDQPRLLIYQSPLAVSARGGEYFLVRGFEEFEAYKKLGQEKTFMQIFIFDSIDEEVKTYKQLNAENIPSVVKEIRQELQKISTDYTLSDIIHEMARYSRDTYDYFFYLLWRDIPEEYLYPTYKDVFEDAAQWFYTKLFKTDMLSKIHRLNKHDTVNNPVLIDMLDEHGYLTVYHGHCKSTLRNSNSWTIDPTIAHFFGCRNASRNDVDDYYIVTGKVKLNDIIAFITERSEKEIVILNKHVKDKHKEFFKHSESNGKYRMFDKSNEKKIEQLMAGRI